MELLKYLYLIDYQYYLYFMANDGVIIIKNISKNVFIEKNNETIMERP